MSRYYLSVIVSIANLMFLFWFMSRHRIDPGISFLALVAAVVVSALVQRWRFGRDISWRARFDPAVVIAMIASFDLALFALPLLRPS